MTITIGPGSVATHGSLAAFGEAHARDGRLPWRELVAPAVDVARGGFALGSASQYYLRYVHESVFGWDDASRAALHDAAGRLTEDRVVVPDLAATLEHIAAVGSARAPRGRPRRRWSRGTCRSAAGCSVPPTWRRTSPSSARR